MNQLFDSVTPTSKLFDATWRVAANVSLCSPATVDWMIRQCHYLKKWPAIPTAIFSLTIGLSVKGVCVYALPPRETISRMGGPTWELARLWISDDVPKNAETWFIGKTIREIRRTHPEVVALVSYADPAFGHSGTIYRAANWTHDGMTDAGRKARCDYFAQGRRYQRRSHVPDGVPVKLIPRSSKHRFIYKLAA